MPLYEYYCATCQHPITILFRTMTQAATEVPLCTTCGSDQLTRLVSQVAVLQSTGPAGQSIAAPNSGPTAAAATNDPQALARAMQTAGAGREMGNDFKEVAARLGKGESATAVETSLRKRVGEKMEPH